MLPTQKLLSGLALPPLAAADSSALEKRSARQEKREARNAELEKIQTFSGSMAGEAHG